MLSAADIPLVIDRAEAEASPERAVLACILHGDGEPVEVARAAVMAAEAAARLPEPRGRIYIELIERHLGAEARELWRAALMTAPGIQWRGEFAVKHREEGRAEKAREILTQLCELRFGSLPGWAKDRISHGTSEELTEWTLRIIQAQTVDDVFDEGGS